MSVDRVRIDIEDVLIDWVERSPVAEITYDDGLVFDGLIVNGVEYGVKIDVWERE